MRKILLALFALALVVAFTTPSYAADLKVTGFYRVRGASVDNADGDDDKDDGTQYLDALIRPRFTLKSGGVMSVWEPEFVSANGGFAIGAGRQTVGVNRWLIDFALPGSALRMRLGKTDYTSPDREVYDGGGRHREPGVAVYGKLSKNLSLSMFHTKAKEDTSADNDDTSDYYVGISAKVAPGLTLSPWAANSRGGAGKTAYNYSFLGLNAKGKMGIFNVNASGVFQSGEINAGTDLSAWAILARTSASFGRLKVMGNLTMLSGDDSQPIGESKPATTEEAEEDVSGVTVTGTRPIALADQEPDAQAITFGNYASADGEYGGFTAPQLGGSGWFLTGQLLSGIGRFSSFGNKGIQNQALVSVGGNKGPMSPVTRTNGIVALEGLVEYKVSKTFTLIGGISLYQSAESAPEACWNNVGYGEEVDGVRPHIVLTSEARDIDGDANTANTAPTAGCDADEVVDSYDDSKDYGTELNAVLKWKIHKTVELRMIAALLMRGDYGKVEGGKDFDDTWMVGWTLRHVF